MLSFLEEYKHELLLTSSLSVLFYGSYRFYQGISYHNNKKKQLKAANIYNPEEIHKIINSTQSQAHFKQNPKNPSELIFPKVIIEGVIDSKSPIKSHFSEKQLIYQEMRRVPIYSNNYLFMGRDGKNYMKSGHLLYDHSTNFELYSLYDQKKQNPCLIMRDCLNFNLQKLEEIGSKTMKLPDISIFENFLVFFGLIIESLCFWFTPHNILGGIFIGYSDKEFGIRAEGMISLLGDLIYNTETKSLVLKRARSVETVLKSLENKIFYTKLCFGLFIGLTGVISFFSYKNMRNNRIKAKYVKNLGNLVNIDQYMKSDDENNLCIICCAKPRSILPQPCMHLSCCKKCFEQLKKKECPICREKFQGYNEIFVDKSLQNKNSL